jgi:hypothetical protein
MANAAVAYFSYQVDRFVGISRDMKTKAFRCNAYHCLVGMKDIRPIKAHTKIPIAHKWPFLRNNPEKARLCCYKRKTLIVKGSAGMN